MSIDSIVLNVWKICLENLAAAPYKRSKRIYYIILGMPTNKLNQVYNTCAIKIFDDLIYKKNMVESFS